MGESQEYTYRWENPKNIHKDGRIPSLNIHKDGRTPRVYKQNERKTPGYKYRRWENPKGI